MLRMLYTLQKTHDLIQCDRRWRRPKWLLTPYQQSHVHDLRLNIFIRKRVDQIAILPFFDEMEAVPVGKLFFLFNSFKRWEKYIIYYRSKKERDINVFGYEWKMDHHVFWVSREFFYAYALLCICIYIPNDHLPWSPSQAHLTDKHNVKAFIANLHGYTCCEFPPSTIQMSNRWSSIMFGQTHWLDNK